MRRGHPEAGKRDILPALYSSEMSDTPNLFTPGQFPPPPGGFTPPPGQRKPMSTWLVAMIVIVVIAGKGGLDGEHTACEGGEDISARTGETDHDVFC